MIEFSKGEAPQKSEDEQIIEFIEREKEAWRAQKKAAFLELEASFPGKPGQTAKKLKEIDELPDEQVLERVFNNLHCWLPASKENKTVGMYRRSGAYGYEESGKEWPPEKVKRKLQLEDDVDAFLKTSNLEEAAARMGALFGKEKTEAQIAENNKFLSRLYFVMRQKGYTAQELRV